MKTIYNALIALGFVLFSAFLFILAKMSEDVPIIGGLMSFLCILLGALVAICCAVLVIATSIALVASFFIKDAAWIDKIMTVGEEIIKEKPPKPC